MHKISRVVESAVRRIQPTGDVGLHPPRFFGGEKRLLSECIETGYVSSVGRFVEQFENQLCRITGVSDSIAVVNGTSALMLAMKVCGVAAGEEVLMPALSFVAGASAIRQLNAYPVFIDSESETFGISPEEMEAWLSASTVRNDQGALVNINSGRVVRAVLAIHIFGHSCKIDKICAVASRFGLKVIEDAAEALGSYFEGKHLGTFGDCGILSFNGNKTITCGGGGAIMCNDVALGQKIRHLSTTAKVKHKFEYIHDDVGFNLRMPNINAALGLAQLQHLSQILTEKRALYKYYKEAVCASLGVSVLGEPESCESNFWLQNIVLRKPNKTLRDQIINDLIGAGIYVRPLWAPMHELSPYSHHEKSGTSVADMLFKSVISIPSSLNVQ
jgi:perosamine synthetase